VYQQQQQQQQQEQQQQDAENPLLDPPFSRIKIRWISRVNGGLLEYHEIYYSMEYSMARYIPSCKRAFSHSCQRSRVKRSEVCGGPLYFREVFHKSCYLFDGLYLRNHKGVKNNNSAT
jgi:hypothetical protein